MKKILSLVLVFVILSIPYINCWASASEPFEDFIKVSSDGFSEFKELDFSGMRKINTNKFISDNIKIKMIFDEMGIKNIEYSPVYNELIADIKYINSVISSTSYYEIDGNNGSAKKISKSECLEKVSKQAKSDIPPTNSETVSENGYMVITTSAIPKTNEPIGTYSILSYYGWLSNPVTRSVDGISVASDNITWNMSNSNDYTATMITPYTEWDGVTTTDDVYIEIKNSPNGIYSNGYYFSFDLPNDVITPSRTLFYRDISMILSGKGRVDNYDDGTQMLWVNSKYAHIQIRSLFSVEFGWQLGEYPGVTINQGSIAETYYHDYLSWNYSLHYGYY